MEIIELKEWATSLPALDVRSARQRAVIGLVFGALLVALAVAAVVTMVAVSDFTPTIAVGIVVLTAVGGLMIHNAVGMRRRLRGAREGSVAVHAPYAFSIGDSTLEFPAYFHAEAESWPLEGTRVTAGNHLGMSALTLEHDGFRRRRYYARALQLEPAEVARRIEAAR
jgi:hypothetical protein